MKVKELKEMTRQQLCDYCRANKIKGYSGKTKQQRVDLILEHHGNILVKKGFVVIDESKPKPKSKIESTKSKSAKNLTIYLYGSSIREDGIGDVDYIMATTSKAKAIQVIKKVSPMRESPNWIRQRLSDVGYSANSIKETNIKPLDNPNVLYMVETSKIEKNIISSRKIPILLKKWDSLGNEIKVKTKSKVQLKPKVKLSGTDGNAFAVMGKVSNALRKAGLGDQVKAFQAEAMSGDYDHLLQTAAKYCDVS